MTKDKLLRLAIFLALSACVNRKATLDQHVIRCWDGVHLGDSSRIKLPRANAIYLRGRTVIVPSSKCANERLQAIEYSESSIVALRHIEYRNTESPLAFTGTMIILPLKQPSRSVVTVRLIEMRDITRLDQHRAAETLKQVHP